MDTDMILRAEALIAWPIWAGGYPDQKSMIELLEKNQTPLKRQIQHHVRSKFGSHAEVSEIDYLQGGYVQIEGLHPSERAAPNSIILHLIISRPRDIPEGGKETLDETTAKIKEVLKSFCDQHVREAWQGANLFDIKISSDFDSTGQASSEFLKQDRQTLNPADSAQHVVILVHGIRDFALWQETVGKALSANGFQVYPTNYGRFDLVRFLIPIQYYRRKAIEEVLNQIRIVKQEIDQREISIIAHSFGTYVVAHIMRKNFDLHFKKIIFCGSVVRYGFPFEQFKQRFDAPILNEVGTRDVWPAIAESVTWGYGSAGTYGFRRPLVRDRWHNKAGHGYFLSGEFCLKYWIPFLKNGEIIIDNSAPESTRFWIQLFSIFKIRYILLFIAALLGYSAW